MADSVEQGTVFLSRNLHVCPICFASFKRKFNAQRHVTACHADFDANVDDNCCNDELYTAEAMSTSQGEEVPVHHHDEHCDNKEICNELSHKHAANNSDYTEQVLLGELLYNPPAATNCDNTNSLEEFYEHDSSESIASVETVSDLEDMDIDEDDNWMYDSCTSHSRVSVKDHAAAVLGYTIQCNCSKEATNDLLKLIELHLPENNRSLLSFTSLKNVIGAWEYDDVNFIEYSG